MQKIITEKIGEKVIILLQGDVDATDSKLSRRLHGRQAHQTFHVWIDCQAIECIKTYGFCHFISQLLLLKQQNVHITLLHMPDRQKHLLRLLQVEHHFTFVPDFQEAYHLVQAS